MSAEETTRGGGYKEKGWCTVSTGEGRHRYETEVDDVGKDTHQTVRQTGTQDCYADDASRQPGRPYTRGGQRSAREISYPGRDNRGVVYDAPMSLGGRVGTSSYQAAINLAGRLTNNASRILDRRAGTTCKQTERNPIGQTVKSPGGGNRDGKTYINCL